MASASSAASEGSNLSKTQKKNRLKRAKQKAKNKEGKTSTTSEANSSKKRPAADAELGKTGETPEDKTQKMTEQDVQMDDSGTEKVADSLAKVLQPFSKEEEDELLQGDGLENLEEEEPSAKKPSYAGAAKKYPGVLKYVHSSTDERLEVTREKFQVLWDRIEMDLALNLTAGKTEPKIRWKNWKAGRGLICFEDQASADQIGELVAKIKVKSTSFRLWDREETSLKLARGPLPDFARGLKREQLADLLKVRNDLRGEILELRVIEPPKDKSGKPIKTKHPSIGMAGGYSISLRCDEELWECLLSRSTHNKGKQVDLKVGVGRPLGFTLQAKKAEPADLVSSDAGEAGSAKNNEASK